MTRPVDLGGSVDTFLCLTVSNVFPSDDLVYLENDPERDEYVINEKGKLYVGQFRKARGRPWAFGQFDDVVLPVACYILELGKLAHSERGNPVQVVRAISAGVSGCEKTVWIINSKWTGNVGWVVVKKSEKTVWIVNSKWTGNVGWVVVKKVKKTVWIVNSKWTGNVGWVVVKKVKKRFGL